MCLDTLRQEDSFQCQMPEIVIVNWVPLAPTLENIHNHFKNLSASFTSKLELLKLRFTQGPPLNPEEISVITGQLLKQMEW